MYKQWFEVICCSKILWVNHHSSVVQFCLVGNGDIGGWNPIVAVYIMLSL